jgi:glutamate racemase
MNKNPIGIFDSGIGGLSVVRQIKKVLPNESIICLADKANFPYGEKTPEQIRKLSEKNVKWLLTQKAKLIVVACNTATVNAISLLRQWFPLTGFVGMEPAIKPAVRESKKGIIILSSPRATKNKQLYYLIKKYVKEVKVFNIGSLELVQAVEEQWNSSKIGITLKKLIPQKILNQTDILVLGCTHFPLIKSQIQKFVGKDIKVIDSGEAVAKRVKAVLEEKRLLNAITKPNYSFFTTGEREVIRRITFFKALLI